MSTVFGSIFAQMIFVSYVGLAPTSRAATLSFARAGSRFLGHEPHQKTPNN